MATQRLPSCSWPRAPTRRFLPTTTATCTPLDFADDHPATLQAVREMLPTREEAYAHLQVIIAVTGLNADLADLVLQGRCVFDNRHCGMAEQFREARRQRQREQQQQQVQEEKEGEADADSISQRVKRRRRE